MRTIFCEHCSITWSVLGNFPGTHNTTGQSSQNWRHRNPQHVTLSRIAASPPALHPRAVCRLNMAALESNRCAFAAMSCRPGISCERSRFPTHAYTRILVSHTHPFNGSLSPTGLPRWVGTRKVKPIWILLKQETVSGNGISWAVCKSASRSRQITTAPHHSVFYRPDALPATQPTASKHWRVY